VNFLQAVLVFSVIKYHPVEYNGQLYPIWADVLGWMITLASNIPIVVIAMYVFHRTSGATIYQVMYHRNLACSLVTPCTSGFSEQLVNCQ
jgi:Sodium:neurotransmitter symporter family